ncbi:MAG: DNA-binding protein [Candidatus Aminicenantes bacterium]
MPATITIKNIPFHLYDILKKNAARNHRSINNEVISLIEKMYLSVKIRPEEFLANARELRKKTRNFLLTEDILDKAKNEGRP